MENSKVVSMKLLIDTRGKRVLFAEAGKDCVDFLFYLLSLPVATVIRLLREEGMGGSLPKLYRSLENLNDTYIEVGKNKDAYLKAAAPVSSSAVPLPALEAASTEALVDLPYEYYNNHYHFAIRNRRDNKMARVASNVAAEGSGGLVKGVVTYMVMDDLEVKPMSTISSIALLNSFNVKNVGALEEKVVSLGMKEATKLLKISLESSNVLTELFCN